MLVLLRIIASIFYQILYMSILASIIGLVILFIQKIINRKISPKCNYFIWFAFIIILIFPIAIPSKISIYNYMDFKEVKVVENDYVVNQLEDRNSYNEVKANNNMNNIKLSYRNFKIIFANVMLLISALKLIRLLISNYTFIKEFGNEIVKDKRILGILDECKNELGIKRNIKIINQNTAKLPAIIGIVDVKILYTETLDSFDDEALKNMFLHELAHYKRKDNLMNFAIMILEDLYWFNPIIKYMFKYIKREMEFATDELAIKNMNIEQTRTYCKTILDAEEMNSTKLVPALGFVDELKYVDKRIDFISLKPKFRKFSKIISFATIFIVLLICLVFYPTSYGITNTPKLYLQTTDGNLTEISNTEDLDDENFKSIEVEKNSVIELKIKNAVKDNYIYCNKTSLDDIVTQERETTTLDNEIVCYEEGEFLYNFSIVNSRKRTFNYVVKVIVK